MSFEVTKTITQEAFLKQAGEMLDHATDISISPEDTAAAAQEVIVALENIESGDLVIQPPLEKAQIELLGKRALGLVGLEEKARIYLDTTRRGRSRIARLADAQARSRMPAPKAPAFRGEGSGVKDY